jgi:ribonucleotide monophosphatase NagD (HAD superfamily)
MTDFTLSPLGHTWILDLDGTILKHNGYKTDGEDSFVPGAKEFLDSIPPADKVIFITSRKEEYKSVTENFLQKNGIRADAIIYDAPYGERILINDRKPSGLETAIAVNINRDEFTLGRIFTDNSL